MRLALAKGAAVMVTSHLGRPKEGVWTEEDSLAPVAKRLSSCSAGRSRWSGTGSTASPYRPGNSCCWRTAG